MKKISRRQILKSASLLASTGLFTPYDFWTVRASQMKNDRLNVGVIGCGSQGMSDMKQMIPYGDFVALADVNTVKFNNVRKRFKENIRPDIGLYQDYRRLLDRKDVDVIIQAVTDHWHTKVNLDSIRSGRDIYAEKPFAFTIEEGKLMRKAVAESKAIFQLGTQQRSADQYHDKGSHPRPFQELVEIVRNGRIGKLKQVWVAIPYLSMKGGPFPEDPIPKTLDWDRYQGQSPIRKYTKFRYNPFRGWYDYCNSMAADWGNHHYDVAHWGMDTENTGPVSIDARAIFPNQGKPDCFDVPDRFFSRLKYENGVEVFFFAALNRRENYGWPVSPHETMTKEQIDWLFGKDVPDEVKTFSRNGVMFVGDKGRVFANRGNVYGKAEEELKENPIPADGWHVRPSQNHMKNFVDCVKSRETPVAPAAIGHRSLTPCLLTNISMRLNRPIQWDPVKEEIVGDPEALAMMSKEQRKPYTVE